MTTALKKARAKLMRRPVGLTCVRAFVIDENGVVSKEAEGVWKPSHPIDARSMRERKFSVGTLVRAEMKKDRNPGFWRKAHVLGGWLADHLLEFQGKGMHDALKHLQEKSGVGCSEVTYDYDDGKIKLTMSRNEAESLNFSDMDEGRFNEIWKGWMEWLRANAWPDLTSEEIDEVEELISEGNQQ